MDFDEVVVKRRHLGYGWGIAMTPGEYHFWLDCEFRDEGRGDSSVLVGWGEVSGSDGWADDPWPAEAP